MKWLKYTLETTTEATDLIIDMLGELGIYGVEVIDKVPLTEAEKKQMYVDILPESLPDDGKAELVFYISDGAPDEDSSAFYNSGTGIENVATFYSDELIEKIREGLEEVSNFVDIGSGAIHISETDNVDRPISPYAATKKSVEIIGHTYHHLYGIDMIQLRFFTVYGPRQRPDLAIHKFTKIISENGKIPFYGDGTTARDYTFIDDIIDGIVKSAQYLENNQGVYEIINLGENEVVMLKNMLSEIEQNLGKKAVLDKLPMQPGDVQKTNADITKAKTLVKYSPRTNFQNGIKKFVEWFLRKKH